MPNRTELKQKMKLIFGEDKLVILALIKLARLTEDPDYDAMRHFSWEKINEAKAKIMLNNVKKANKFCKGKGKECKFYTSQLPETDLPINGCKLIGLCKYEGVLNGTNKK